MQKCLIIILAFLLLQGCTSSVSVDDDGSRIFIIYTDWAESVALSHLTAFLLDEKLDYEIEMRLTSIDTVFNEIAAGEADVFLDAWIPSTHQDFLELYKDRIEDLGPNYDDARTGLVVPEYMEVKSIGDLENTYLNPVAGIDREAGIMQNARRAIDAYNLSNELLVLSDAEMSERVEDAVKRREDIVFTGWEPHWLFYRYDFKYLEDPLNIFPVEDKIHTIARRGFTEDHPAARLFFERMVLTEEQLNELLYEIRLTSDPLEGASVWAANNEFVVNQWVRDLKEEREKVM